MLIGERRGVGKGGAACGVGSTNVNDSVKSYIKLTEIRSIPEQFYRAEYYTCSGITRNKHVLC